MWNNLWSVSRYVMGPLSGRWRQSGNDPQCLAAPIWKYRSGLGDHRFNFFIDLRSNYTFYTNLINIIHWVVAYRDVAHLVRLNLGKSWAKSAKSFDAGLSKSLTWPTADVWVLWVLRSSGVPQFTWNMLLFTQCLLNNLTYIFQITFNFKPLDISVLSTQWSLCSAPPTTSFPPLLTTSSGASQEMTPARCASLQRGPCGMFFHPVGVHFRCTHGAITECSPYWLR